MLDERHGAAEAHEHLSDLAPHGPATDDQCRCRQLVRRVEVFTGPERRRGEARDVGLPEPAARGDDQVAPADAHRAGRQNAVPLDPAPSLDHPHALRLKTLHGLRVVPMRGDDIAAGHGRRVGFAVAVERQRPAGGADLHRHAPDVLPQFRGREHGLAGDAGEVGALSTHQPLLHQRHTLAAGRQQRCGVLAGRATAQNHDVIGVHAARLSRRGRVPARGETPRVRVPRNEACTTSALIRPSDVVGMVILQSSIHRRVRRDMAERKPYDFLLARPAGWLVGALQAVFAVEIP